MGRSRTRRRKQRQRQEGVEGRAPAPPLKTTPSKHTLTTEAAISASTADQRKIYRGHGKTIKYFFPDEDIQKTQNLLTDDEAHYSVTPSRDAYVTAKFMELFVGPDSAVVDGTSCIGGNTYGLRKVFNRVIANDIDPPKCMMLRHNLRILEGRWTDPKNFFCTDINILLKNDEFVSWENISGVFLDPPWGGVGYKEKTKLDVFLEGVHVMHVIEKIASLGIPVVCLKLPDNSDFYKVKTHLKRKTRMRNWIRMKMKKYTVLLVVFDVQEEKNRRYVDLGSDVHLAGDVMRFFLEQYRDTVHRIKLENYKDGQRQWEDESVTTIFE